MRKAFLNPRILLFCLVVLALIGFPTYVFLEEKLTGGIKNRGDVLEVDLKAMSTFEFDQQYGRLEDIPEKWRALDGKRVQVQGEMYQPQEAGGKLAAFELVYSIQTCCLTSTPQIQHFVLGRVQPGREVYAYPGLVKVTGILHVKVERSEGKVTRVYSIDVESVEKV